MSRSDWSSKADRIKALERVLADPNATPYTVMEASKEIRRLTSRRRRASVARGSLDDVNASLREWWQRMVLPSLGVEAGAIELFMPDTEELTFKPIVFHNGGTWKLDDGTELVDDVPGRVWRRTGMFAMWWAGRRLSEAGVYVPWSRLRWPKFDPPPGVYPGWASGDVPFPLGEPVEYPRVASGG